MKFNFAVMKSTITLPFFKWHKGKKEDIAIALPISTNSKSPIRGFKNIILLNIEIKLIKITMTRIIPPKIARI